MCQKKVKVRVVEEACNELEMGNNRAGLREISKFTSGITKAQCA